ncbi:MAG: hypothetical protein EA341_06665 [Mongoliibacter sp.]|uniref:YdeI/OmpD-associated family protein n=1 Tax=Mongoliibacter sp. TaxID=2022438 RepID=UPI0012F38007|nr:MAG: hypothetical protein EA341_06665 [Mongoliibacter sp.]
MKLNPKIDKYLIDGCMRCKYGGTPQCKVLSWVQELELLRQIVLDTGLKEEIKWGVPVYTYDGKNIVTVNALKDSANIGFFKGAIMKDTHKILKQQGNIQSARLIRFSDVDSINELKDILKVYILEAIAIEKSGEKVKIVKNPEPIPEELLQAFDEDSSFKKAFFSLTPGRQRGYNIHFSQPKQAKTRIARIAKYKKQIKAGVGLHDNYKQTK